MLNGMSVLRFRFSAFCAPHPRRRTTGGGVPRQPARSFGVEGKAQPIENKGIGSASPMLRCRNPKQDSRLRKTKGLPESQGITVGAHFGAKLRPSKLLGNLLKTSDAGPLRRCFDAVTLHKTDACGRRRAAGRKSAAQGLDMGTKLDGIRPGGLAGRLSPRRKASRCRPRSSAANPLMLHSLAATAARNNGPGASFLPVRA